MQKTLIRADNSKDQRFSACISVPFSLKNELTHKTLNSR